MREYRFVLFLIIVLAVVACKQNKWEINTSAIETNQEFKQFHAELFALNTDSLWDYIPDLEIEYGNFFEVYNTRIINIGGTNQLDYNSKLAYFLTDPDIIGAYGLANKKIDLPKTFIEIGEGFKRYRYYFPNKIIPHIYTHISGFNQSVVIDTNYISIALDKYLGTNAKYYQMLRTPMYKRLNMYPEKIPSDVFFAWSETEFLYGNSTENLINKMIYYGKLHIFLDAMLPNAVDSVKLGFSGDQLAWCKKNESQMWVYLVENKLLFSTAFKDLNKYLNEGPFTSTFSKQSPARSGRWIGYQIVQSYLKANPNVTLPQLMENTNYQQILNESKYKP